MIFGYILVILGGLFLLDNLEVLPRKAWEYFWPLLLIVWGLSIIFGKGRRGLWNCCLPYRERDKEKTESGGS